MGTGSSRAVITENADRLVAESFIEATTQCQVQSTATQTMTLDCLPETDPGTVYEENPSCLQQLNNILTSQASNHALWRGQWSKGIVGPPTAQIYQEALNQFNGITTCKKCIWGDNLQLQAVQFDVGCSFTISMLQEMLQLVNAKFANVLYNNQDVFSTLAQIVGGGSDQEVSTRLANKVMANFSVSTLTEMSVIINNNQQMNFLNSNIQGTRQVATTEILQRFLSDQQFTNNVLTDAEWDQYETLWNDQNTITQVGDVVTDSTLAIGEAIDSTLGIILVVVSIVCILILLITTIFVLKKAVES